MKLYGAGGEVLLDMVSSWWVNLHGHAQPEIAAAIAEQASTLEHVIFAGYTHAPAAHFAAELAATLPPPLSRIFYSDNGSTATEVALKIALQYHHNRGVEKHRILALSGGYHGDTFGAMSAGKDSGFYKPFGDKLFTVDFIPYPETWQDDPDINEKEAASLNRLDELLESRDVAAVILEPLVQGASGMRMSRASWVAEVARRVRAADGLVIFDEVMTGFGRTAKLWATDWVGVTPDLLCLSKGITGGFLPLGVTAATEQIYEAFAGEDFSMAFAHGHSYTANPLCVAAARASLKITKGAETSTNWTRISASHAAVLPELAAHAGLERVRQCGTILAADVCGGGEYGGNLSLAMRDFFMKNGLLMRPLGNTIYLLPPFIISDQELQQGYDAITEAAYRFSRS